MSALLEFRDLTKKYGAKLAVDRINLTIEGGHHRSARSKRQRQDNADQDDQRSSYSHQRKSVDARTANRHLQQKAYFVSAGSHLSKHEPARFRRHHIFCRFL